MTILTTPTQRREFYRRHLRGQTYEEIAKMYGLSKECIRYWCRKQRDGGSTKTKYYRRGKGILSAFRKEVRERILAMKQKHSGWGPDTILFHLKQEPEMKYLKLPSRTSIGRYLHQWTEFHRKKKGKEHRERPSPPKHVHHHWQGDFKMDIKLEDGTRVNLHTIRDPYGGATIGAYLYQHENPNKQAKHVKMEDVRTTLRNCFAQWGTIPDEVQTDGETTLVSSKKGAFPSIFTLWLAGLGIEHRVIRAGRPTDNAEVERCHRTLNEYAIIGNEDQDIDHLQAILDQSVYELNYQLPSHAKGCKGKTPIAAHPELLKPRRPYHPEQELILFDLDHVDAFLASFTWKRKVGKTGQIALGGQHTCYSVGRAFARKTVLVRFDPEDRNFVFFDTTESGEETEIKRCPARDLDTPHILGLELLPDGIGPQQLLLPFPMLEGVSVQ